MKLATFRARSRVSYGVVTDAGIVDAGVRLGADLPDLMQALARGGLARLDALSSQPADLGLDDVTLLKPILRPGKIICAGANYRGRNEEDRNDHPLPQYPTLFMRVPESLVAHREPLVRPLESPQLDYEGAIALVIGRSGRRLAPPSAMSYVAGYTICNEGAVRDWCTHRECSVTPGKNFARSGAVGPFLVTTDDAGAGPLRLVTRVNGEVRQEASTERMIVAIPQLLAYISTFCTLEPGDIVVTGTPPGAGAQLDPPRFLVPGDEVEVEVEGVGTLANIVVDERPVVASVP